MEKKIEHNCNIIHDRKRNINFSVLLMISHKLRAPFSMSFNNVCPFACLCFIVSARKGFPSSSPTSCEKSFFFIRFDSWKSHFLMCAHEARPAEETSQKQWAVYAIITLLMNDSSVQASTFFPFPISMINGCRSGAWLWQIVWLHFVSFFSPLGSSERIALDKSMLMNNKKWDSWNEHKQFPNGSFFGISEARKS